MPENTSHGLTNCRHVASRRAGAVEYLERCPQQTEVSTEAFPAKLATGLAEASALLNKYHDTGDAELLDRAAQVTCDASREMPDDDPHLGATLSYYEAIMDAQLVGAGIIESRSLDKAVEVAERALSATPLGHPCRGIRCSNLSSWKGRRFEWHSYPADLEMAIENAESALVAFAADGTLKAGVCNNLGYWLGRRFDLVHHLSDLDRAVDVTQEAVAETPCGDPLLGVRLNNLAVRLHRRFMETWTGSDIDRAIQVAHMAVQTPGISVWIDRCFWLIWAITILLVPDKSD